MRHRFRLIVPFLAAGLVLGACKIVSNADRDAERAGAEVDVVARTVEEIWDARAVPHIEQGAVPLGELLPAIRSGLDAAGTEHGYRQESEGSPWNFAASLTGTIVAANTESRAATAAVDIDGDGTADAVLQLGPVIKGTTLRDVLPFISFTDFRDQIEFAKLARALNTHAYETALESLTREALVGAQVTALGVFTLGNAGGDILITPIRITVTP